MTTFDFAVDDTYAYEHNELLKDTKRLQISALIFAIILLAIGVGLFFYFKDMMGILVLACFSFMAVMTLTLIAIIPRKVGTPAELYTKYPLVPAVVAKKNDHSVVLLALVNANIDQSLPPRWALAARTVNSLPNHAHTVGERVPSVAVAGKRSMRKDATTWDEVSPMPIAWGTPHQATIDRAKNSIPEEQWKRLNRYTARVEDVLATAYNYLPLDT